MDPGEFFCWDDTKHSKILATMKNETRATFMQEGWQIFKEMGEIVLYLKCTQRVEHHDQRLQ